MRILLVQESDWLALDEPLLWEQEKNIIYKTTLMIQKKS